MRVKNKRIKKKDSLTLDRELSEFRNSKNLLPLGVLLEFYRDQNPFPWITAWWVLRIEFHLPLALRLWNFGFRV